MAVICDISKALELCCCDVDQLLKAAGWGAESQAAAAAADSGLLC